MRGCSAAAGFFSALTVPLPLVALFGSFMMGAGKPSAAPAAPQPSANIILITLDTTRADHLGCYGYLRDTSPNIDRFAAEAVLFERAYCPMATTLPSHTSIFTGLYPLQGGVFANINQGGGAFVSGPGARSIVEMLREEGYATAAFVSGTPVKRVGGLAVGFEVYDEPEEAERPAALTTTKVLSWLEGNAGKKFFLWVHYFDPHWPRQAPAPFGTQYGNEPSLDAWLAERRFPEAVEAAQCKLATVTRTAINGYDGEIRYLDSELGRLFDRLRSSGVWDKSVIILAGDHGEGLNQHDWPAHGRNWEEQLRVPLIIRFPGQRGNLPKRFKPLVSLMDVMPTVLGRIQPRPAKGFLEQAAGANVLASDFQERPILAMRSGNDCGDNAGPMFALVTPKWKYFHEPSAKDRLYNRATDPDELRDVLAVELQVGGALRRQTLELIKKLTVAGRDLAAGRNMTPQAVDPDVLQELESLGYVGAAKPATRPTRKRAPAPTTQPRGPE